MRPRHRPRALRAAARKEAGAAAGAAEEGVGAYFKGAGSNILRGLGGTLVLVGFDYFKMFYIQMRYGVSQDD